MPFFDSSDASTDSFQALQPGGCRASKPVAVPKHQQPAGHKRHAHERSSSQLSGSPPGKETEVLQAKHAKRAGKPTASTASRRASSPPSDAEMSSPPQLASAQRKPRSGGKKHALDATPGGAAPAATKPAGAGQRQSPPRKRPEPAIDMRQLAATAAAGAALLRTPGGAKPAPRAALPTKFAGPAFTNSPTPDCLPIPTSSLLLAEAAEGLRSRLTL